MERLSSRCAHGARALGSARRALLGLALLTLVACGDPLGATPSPGPVGGSRGAERDNESPDNDFELVGTQWALISLDGEDLLGGTTITLNVGSKRLGGSAGCNGYGARYSAPGGGALTVVEIWGAAMGCPAPEGIMEQERRYLGMLRDVATYHLDDGRLRLETGDGCSRPAVRWPCTPPGRVLVFTARD